MPHVPRRQELALLDVDGAPGQRRGDEQVGLAAKESRDLQHIDDFGGEIALTGLVHVGQRRQAEAIADFAKMAAPP